MEESVELITVTLPGQYVPEVKGKMITLFGRKTERLAMLTRMQKYPFEDSDRGVSLDVHIFLDELAADSELFAKSEGLLAQELETQAARLFRGIK